MLDSSPDKEKAQIKEAAIRLLARREHSQLELLRKLNQKGFDYSVCQAVVSDLEQQGYQSEQRFAQMFIRARAAKYYGPARIVEELKQHQVSGSLVSTAMQELEIDWFELCKDSFIRKFRHQVADDWPARQKQKRYLWQRGFSEEQIQYALSSD